MAELFQVNAIAYTWNGLLKLLSRHIVKETLFLNLCVMRVREVGTWL